MPGSKLIIIFQRKAIFKATTGINGDELEASESNASRSASRRQTVNRDVNALTMLHKVQTAGRPPNHMMAGNGVRAPINRGEYVHMRLNTGTLPIAYQTRPVFPALQMRKAFSSMFAIRGAQKACWEFYPNVNIVYHYHLIDLFLLQCLSTRRGFRP